MLFCSRVMPAKQQVARRNGAKTPNFDIFLVLTPQQVRFLVPWLSMLDVALLWWCSGDIFNADKRYSDALGVLTSEEQCCTWVWPRQHQNASKGLLHSPVIIACFQDRQFVNSIRMKWCQDAGTAPLRCMVLLKRAEAKQGLQAKHWSSWVLTWSIDSG